MKRTIVILTVLFSMMFWADFVNAQTQTAPPPPGSHGQTTDQAAGGGAPIGGGLFILLGLGAAYGGRKLYQMKTEKPEA